MRTCRITCLYQKPVFTSCVRNVIWVANLYVQNCIFFSLIKTKYVRPLLSSLWNPIRIKTSTDEWLAHKYQVVFSIDFVPDSKKRSILTNIYVLFPYIFNDCFLFSLFFCTERFISYRFPIQMYAITVLICGNFWGTQYIASSASTIWNHWRGLVIFFKNATGSYTICPRSLIHLYYLKMDLDIKYKLNFHWRSIICLQRN